MVPYRLMYRIGAAPWEQRNVDETWARIMRALGDPPPGRALDVGCGSGRDAVYLAKRGWRVTGVDFAAEALAKARRRASEEGADVQFIEGDVGRLDQLGFEPGYDLLYDFGCIQGLPDAARQGAARGLDQLAAPGASLLMFAFTARGRPLPARLLLPRGMDEPDIVALLGGGWDHEQTQSVATDDMPAFARASQPTLYRFSHRDGIA